MIRTQLAIAAVLLAVPQTAAAGGIAVLPGKTVLLTKTDRSELQCFSCAKAHPASITLPRDAIVVRRLRWTGWGSSRAVGIGNASNPAQALKATVTFTASRPRRVYSPAQCGSGGRYFVRLYTRLSFTEKAFNGLTGRSFVARSHSNLAVTNFPFDC